jgi:hypothetical protein
MAMMRLRREDPRVVGPFRLHRRLGSGGMGVVYLGADRRGQKVALKLIRAELAEDREFHTRFAREVAAARRIRGGCIARLVAADIDADRPWLATAYVPGPSLYKKVMDEGPLPWTDIAGVGAALADGLYHVHEAGVVHRDLKPSNILLSPKGPRIIDFGIAWATGASTLTHVGTAVGSPGFLAPEQVRGAAVTSATDVFALGSTLAYAATGDSPFGSGTSEVMLYRVVHEEPDLRGVPGPLVPVIRACLAKEPVERPGTRELGELLWELPSLAASAAQSAPPAPGPPESPPGADAAAGPAGPAETAAESGGGADARRGGVARTPRPGPVPGSPAGPTAGTAGTVRFPGAGTAEPAPRTRGAQDGGIADGTSGGVPGTPPAGRGPRAAGGVRGGARGPQGPRAARGARDVRDARAPHDTPAGGEAGAGGGAAAAAQTGPSQAEPGPAGAAAAQGVPVPETSPLPRSTAARGGSGPGTGSGSGPRTRGGGARASGAQRSGRAGGPARARRGATGLASGARKSRPGAPAGGKGGRPGKPVYVGKARSRRLLRQRLIVFITVTIGVALAIAAAQGWSHSSSKGGLGRPAGVSSSRSPGGPDGAVRVAANDRASGGGSDAIGAAAVSGADPNASSALTGPQVDWANRTYRDPAGGPDIPLSGGRATDGQPTVLTTVLAARYRDAPAAAVVLTRTSGGVPQDLVELFRFAGGQPVLVASHASTGDAGAVGSWRIADGAVLREEHAGGARGPVVSRTRYAARGDGQLDESWPGR